MTPFGEKVRLLRRERGISQRDMAASIGVSPAYLSALEHGRRGVPIGFFNIIWDDAEELQRLAEQSHPRVVIDTAGLSPRATELSNLLARTISSLGEPEIEMLIRQLRDTQRE
ncbi:MAG: helix-turn-helix transcriptional regulator [Rhizobiales bacterium]|nr:helix-turn-helix transcriptional regulator [Hyphomicrobiales bacterium]